MEIKKYVRFNHGVAEGYVDMGIGFENDSEEIAIQVLVFMLTCINMNWNIPIGFFAINGISAEEKARLVKIALYIWQRFWAAILVTQIILLLCSAMLVMLYIFYRMPVII